MHAQSPIGMNANQKQSPVRLASPAQAQAFEPGGFWIRAVALLIDSLILFVLQFPLSFITGFLAALVSIGTPPNSAMGIGVQGLSMITSIAVSFAYYGYFYRNRGGTPGKLIFGLRVVDVESGTFLSWKQIILREGVGKTLDVLTLGIGLYMAAFRHDKRALHDFVGGTQVLRPRR